MANKLNKKGLIIGVSIGATIAIAVGVTIPFLLNKRSDSKKETCSVTYNGFEHLALNDETQFNKTIEKGSDFSGTFTIVEDDTHPEYCHYLIPPSVDVFVNNILLTDKQFSYAPDTANNTATITIPNVKKNLSIVAHADMDFYRIVYKYDELKPLITFEDVTKDGVGDPFIDWGDGTQPEEISSSSPIELTHDYKENRLDETDFYEIKIYGNISGTTHISKIAIAGGSSPISYFGNGNENIVSIDFANTLSGQLSMSSFACPMGKNSLLESVYFSTTTKSFSFVGQNFKDNKKMSKLIVSRKCLIATDFPSVFEGTNVKEFIVPDAITTMQQECLAGMSSLESLVFRPNTKLNTIKTWAFDNSSLNLKKLYIPATVQTIEENGLANCKAADVYCACAEDKKPTGWHDDWLGTNASKCKATIHWSSPQYPEI